MGFHPEDMGFPQKDLTTGERTVPHPILYATLDKEAEYDEIPDVKIGKKSDYAYYPGCVDYYDYEMQFSRDNYGVTDHGIIFDSSVKLMEALGLDPVILDREFMKF